MGYVGNEVAVWQVGNSEVASQCDEGDGEDGGSVGYGNNKTLE